MVLLDREWHRLLQEWEPSDSAMDQTSCDNMSAHDIIIPTLKHSLGGWVGRRINYVRGCGYVCVCVCVSQDPALTLKLAEPWTCTFTCFIMVDRPRGFLQRHKPAST